MRWNCAVTTAAFALVAFFGCDGEPAQTSLMPGRPLIARGYITVRTIDPHTIEVAVNEPWPAGRADQGFYLASNETLPAIDRSFQIGRASCRERV